MFERKDRLSWLLLLATGLVLCWAIFFLPDQLQLRSEEPRRAIVALEMIFSGDYWIPTLNGWPYYNKPPVFNWLIAASMQIFGSWDEWAIRLPGLLSFVLTGLLIFLFVRKHAPLPVALLSSLIFLTGGEILFYGLIIAGQIDLFYTLLVLLQMIGLFKALSGRKLAWWIYSYVFLALGVLTKGLPSVAFQILTLLGWLLCTRNIKMLVRWQHILAALLSLLVVGSYFWIYQQKGGQADIYLVNLYKEAAQKSLMEGEGSSILKNGIAFPGLFVKLLLPWSPMLFFLFVRPVRRAVWSHPLTRFCIIFLVSNIPLYAFASYLSLRYLYPLIPFYAILIGFILGQVHEHRLMRYFYYLTLVFILLPPIVYFSLFWLPEGSIISKLQVKLSISLLISGLLLFIWIKKENHRLLLTFLAVALLKLYSNWIYYPIRAADELEHSLLAQIREIRSTVENEPVMLYGEPEIIKSDLSLGPVTLGEVSFSSPMPLSYQLPFYLERWQGQTMEFHTVMQPRVYYLTREAYIDPALVDIYYFFEDDWRHIPLVVCRLK